MAKSSSNLSPTNRRQWFRISSTWLQDLMELSPKQRLKQIKPLMEELSARLETKGFTSELRSGLSLWILELIEVEAQHTWRVKPVRILHPMEREFISAEAYGLFIQSLQSGIIPATESEAILEALASKHPLPLGTHELEGYLAEYWLKQISKYRPQ